MGRNSEGGQLWVAIVGCYQTRQTKASNYKEFQDVLQVKPRMQ